MTVDIISTLGQKNSGTFPLVQDTAVAGGYRVEPTTTTRDAITTDNKKIGMLVYCQDVQETYRWDGTNWVVAFPVSGTYVYMFANAASDIGSYRQMVNLPNYTVGSLGTIATGISTTPTILGVFASNSGYPGITVIPTGLISVHYDMEKTAGSNNYYSYAELYTRTSGGTETLIATTDNSTQSASNTILNTTVTAYLSSNVTLDASDRVVVKIYGVMVSSTATITLRYDDSTSARLEFPGTFPDISTSTLQSVYNSSSTGQVTTDATRGALDLLCGSGSNSDYIYIGRNIAGGMTSYTTGGGAHFAALGYTGNLTGNVTGNVTGDLTGTASTATVATTVSTANEITDTTCFIPFFTSSGTGNYALKNSNFLSYNSATAWLYSGAGLETGTIQGLSTGNLALQTPPVGTNTVPKAITFRVFDASGTATAGNGFQFTAGAGATTGAGGSFNVTCGNSGNSGTGGHVTLTAGNAGTTAQGGNIYLNSGTVSSGTAGKVIASGNVTAATLTVTGAATAGSLTVNSVTIVDDGAPMGTMIEVATAAFLSSKWVIADGSAVSRATYSAFWAGVSATWAWGNGDGSTTFNTPNTKGRLRVTTGDSTATGHTNHTTGTLAGEETHVQTTAELVQHLHADGTLATGYTYLTPTATGAITYRDGSDAALYSSSVVNGSTANTGTSTAATMFGAHYVAPVYIKLLP